MVIGHWAQNNVVEGHHDKKTMLRKIIPSKLEVAPNALKMSEWVTG